MTQQNKIQLFEEKKVRTLWDETEEKWYFSIVDVVAVLTDSVNPTDYLKKIKKRDPFLAEGWGQIVTPLSMQTAGGKQKVVTSLNAKEIHKRIESGKGIIENAHTEGEE